MVSALNIYIFTVSKRLHVYNERMGVRAGLRRVKALDRIRSFLCSGTSIDMAKLKI